MSVLIDPRCVKNGEECLSSGLLSGPRNGNSSIDRRRCFEGGMARPLDHVPLGTTVPTVATSWATRRGTRLV